VVVLVYESIVYVVWLCWDDAKVCILLDWVLGFFRGLELPIYIPVV